MIAGSLRVGFIVSSVLELAPRTNDTTWSRFWTLRDTGLDEAALPRIGRVVGSMEEELETITR